MSAWQRTLKAILRLFGSQYRLWAPFLLIAGFQVFLIGLVWLAPHAPYSTLLAPPIRYFSGDRVLHYPVHFWYLYHVMKQVYMVTNVVAGAYLSGLAALMVRQAHEGKAISIRNARLSGKARYFSLVALWIIIWLIASGIFKATGQIKLPHVFLVSINVGLAVLLQALLAYPITIAVLEGLPWWKALLRGLAEFFRYPLQTIGIVLVPSALLIAFAFFASESHLLKWMMDMATPELSLLFVFARLGVVTAADAVITLGIARLWLFHHQPGRASGK